MSDYTLPWLIWTQGIAIATAVVVGRWAVNRLRGREAVALVDDENCSPVLARRCNDLAEGLGDEGAHLADHSAAPNPVA
jgi:hypothetical protein